MLNNHDKKEGRRRSNSNRKMDCSLTNVILKRFNLKWERAVRKYDHIMKGVVRQTWVHAICWLVALEANIRCLLYYAVERYCLDVTITRLNSGDTPADLYMHFNITPQAHPHARPPIHPPIHPPIYTPGQREPVDDVIGSPIHQHS